MTSHLPKLMTGEWVAGKKQGYGTMTLVNGTSQAGNWHEDVYTGPASPPQKSG